MGFFIWLDELFYIVTVCLTLWKSVVLGKVISEQLSNKHQPC
jgi:hypothetical protein